MGKNVCLIDYDMSVRGGVEQVTASLSNALADSCEVHVISLFLAGEPAYALDERVTFTALRLPEGRLREQRKALRPLLTDYFAAHRIDVAIIQGHFTAFLASAVRFHTKTRLVFSDHGALINQWGQRDITTMRWIDSLLCQDVVVLTEQSRQDYYRKFHTPRKKVRCIYNWIDLDVPRSEQYDVGSRRILSAGRFGKEKGFDLLVKAFAPVAKRHPDWHLDLYGDGEMMPAVQQCIAQLGLEGNVHLMGMRTDLAARYGDYAMYVLPSYREGMPLVLLEAKANRLPIVSFDIMTGPREIVRDEADGLLVQPYDLDKLGRAMCRLIEDPALRKRMSDRSQENLRDFSKEEIKQKWLALICEAQ